VAAPYAEKILGAYETPCRLCQVKIPCERKNPMVAKTHENGEQSEIITR